MVLKNDIRNAGKQIALPGSLGLYYTFLRGEIKVIMRGINTFL